uniref:Uncharacterized protein n=1 Tax=Alexandrium monilatum TaxID=311494 RepID=A0A7S4QC75_9DINO
MEGVFSSLLGQVDASIEQRSSLVAALRAKLGVSDPKSETLALGGAGGRLSGSVPGLLEVSLEGRGQPEEPQEPEVEALPPGPAAARGPLPDPAPPLLTVSGGGSFTDAMAQLDRGLEERQKLIDALKAQLSKSAAYPKSSMPCPAADPEDWGAGSASAMPPAPASSPPPAAGLLEEGQRRQAGLAPLTPVPATQGLPRVVDMGDYGPVAAKRPRLSTPSAGLEATPKATGVAQDDTAALAARKAEMLRGLGAVEATGTQPAAALAPGAAAPAGAADVRPAGPAEAPAASAPALLGSPAAPRAAPAQRLSGSGPVPPPPPAAAASAIAPPAAAPPAALPAAAAPPAPPPGATPEQMEAFRQQCWRKYYEYCSVWQKYYAQNSAKAAQSKSKPHVRPGGLVPAGMPSDPAATALAAHGPGNTVASWPLATPAPVATRGAPGAVQLPLVKNLIEDDIHSKLLGL